MAVDMVAATKYVEETYPGKKFNVSQIARVYLQEVKGVKFNSAKIVNSLSNGADKKIFNTKKCPGCGEPMYRFPLCPSCDKSGEGWRSVFVCKNSVGIHQHVNFDPSLGETYEKFLILHRVDYPKTPTCKQEAILSKDGGM